MLLPAVALTGCGNKHVLDIDQHFSYNLIKTPSWFPDEKQKKGLGPGQLEILESHGRPDYMRILWRADGTLITSRDLSNLQPDQIGEKLQESDKSWIYPRDEQEIVFIQNGASYRVEPLTEKIKLVCSYGDPSDMSPPVMRDGQMHETWKWIEYGIIIEFADDHEIHRQRFTASGAGTYILK